MATFTNQARLSYGGNVALSNITFGEILDTVTAVKTPVSVAYAPDGDVTYSLSLVNSGTTDINGITVTDNLGEYNADAGNVFPLDYREGTVRLFIDGVLQPAPAVTANQPLTISGINLPAGSNAILIYEATPNEFTPLEQGSIINNQATVTSADLVAPITTAATLPVEVAPALAILKSISPVAVRDNSRITYTFTIQNTGNEAVTDAVINDTFAPRLSNLAVTYNGTQWTSPAQYTYNDATGVFATNAGQITVPAATYNQDETTGVITTVPGTATVTVTGTI
ncbi:MAG: hypothetical protein KBS52_06495 [Clostridiales bacterium]|nr:hypothetical protein [Candidatus Equinaster intestinalis]